MKALILAAGFGTRLLPYTKKIPKPLFTICSRPVLEHLIKKLVDIGCDQILINTHHLHMQINDFVDKIKEDVDIQILHEPAILDTGGAIANAKSFLNDEPFFVINSDVISNIDLKTVYEFHIKSNHPATLVLHDHEKFNKVGTDDKGYIKNFNSKSDALAFTGIQVLSPQIFDYFPDKKTFSSIEVYEKLCSQNQVKAFVAKDIFWSDIGTKESYSMTSLLELAASQFKISQDKIREIQVEKLAGDGSDRRWYRAEYDTRSFIISDHGICMPESEELAQLNAFIHIGNHLCSKDLPLPCILNHDTLSGMVILEDLGDIHLETMIKQENNTFTLAIYKKVIDILIDFSIKGLNGFQTEWTCQTKTYSKELILEKECRYFMEAFIQGYLNLDLDFSEFADEFDYIADHALKYEYKGLMHRDMQSRNIMIKNDQIYFIDFQSARTGPLQYDLASLLIDPYVSLNKKTRDDLLQYTMDKLNLDEQKKEKFSHGYQYCCLTRNLQFLGAFSFLSQAKKKKSFESHIPNAIKSLKRIMSDINSDKLPKLSKLVQTL